MGSIGYTLPATLGTQIAAPHRRNVLLIGDGSPTDSSIVINND